MQVIGAFVSILFIWLFFNFLIYKIKELKQLKEEKEKIIIQNFVNKYKK
ncbi:MAG TPA: hypothetical protein PL104_03100 [Caldisericia bacterium]|nr:hypothetical protein [Caldisericia bacterium]HQO99495.1 hypothetical protein [Caldisericia bacterium]